MKKYLFPIIGLILILLIISAGCIKPPFENSGTSSGNDQQSSEKTTTGSIVSPTITTGVAIINGNNITISNGNNITPNFKVGQIASKSSTATSGLAIVDYNSATGMYGTKEVKKNSKGDGWYTDGYQLLTWKDVATVDKDYKYVINLIINPTDIPEYDVTKEVNVFLSTPCDLVGDWNVNKGASIYKFRLDNIVVNQTGNQTLIGDWVTVTSKDKRDFVIRWRYPPYPNSANYMEKITLSSDYSKFDSIDNYGYKKTATWIGIVPSWKAELDKAKPDKQAEIQSGTDCYKWLGGGEWYNQLV